MEFTLKLKERFCKDCYLPIKVYQEPYFSDRIQLLASVYPTLKCLNIFKASVLDNPEFKNEQDYFAEYNRVKDEAIGIIKGSSQYNIFNTSNMDFMCVDAKFKDLPKKDIFHASNVGRKFVSVDMQKANFSALRHFSSKIFNDADTWEDFISNFTSVEHIINSKYIRQVILGNCNPRRQVTYEHHLMSNFLLELFQTCPQERSKNLLDIIVFFSNDEVIFDVTDINLALFEFVLDSVIRWYDVPMKSEVFTLHKFENSLGYYKEIYNDDNSISIELKCVNSYSIPYALRSLFNQEIQESDKVFLFEGRLAKFID